MCRRPTSSERTAGAFLRDPKLFLLQTPHFFANPDPIEKNLRTFRDMPGENEMFYSGIQKGLDHWNGAYFCGSAALMRRRCLEEHGGFSGDSITEDAETALTLHAAGYHSAYIDRPMVCGLACESIPAFLQQRCRWGTGMLQIFLLKNPLFLRGLTLSQRLCYMSSCFFRFFPFTRVVFLFSPILFLLFGLKIYDTDAAHVALFAVPHLLGVFMLNHFLFGRLRWAFIGDIYEIIQSVPLLPAMVGTLLRPRAPVFKVTAKGERLERDHLSPFARPYVILFLVNLGAMLFGLWRAVATDTFGAAGVTMVWSMLNCLFLLACLGAMVERRQVRASPRLPANHEARLHHDGAVHTGRLTDLSNGGAGLNLTMPGSMRNLPKPGGESVLEVKDAGGRWLRFHGSVRNGRISGSTLRLGFAFAPKDDAEKLARIRLVFGDSQRWVDFQEIRRRHAHGIPSSLAYVIRVGGLGALEYFGYRLLGFLRRRKGRGWVDLHTAEGEPDGPSASPNKASSAPKPPTNEPHEFPTPHASSSWKNPAGGAALPGRRACRRNPGRHPVAIAGGCARRRRRAPSGGRCREIRIPWTPRRKMAGCRMSARTRKSPYPGRRRCPSSRRPRPCRSSSKRRAAASNRTAGAGRPLLAGHRGDVPGRAAFGGETGRRGFAPILVEHAADRADRRSGLPRPFSGAFRGHDRGACIRPRDTEGRHARIGMEQPRRHSRGRGRTARPPQRRRGRAASAQPGAVRARHAGDAAGRRLPPGREPARLHAARPRRARDGCRVAVDTDRRAGVESRLHPARPRPCRRAFATLKVGSRRARGTPCRYTS